MQGLEENEYRDSSWYFATPIHRWLVRAPLQTVDELLPQFAAPLRPSPSFCVDEFRCVPLAADHVRSILQNELRDVVDGKDGRWYATSKELVRPPIWLKTPFSWDNEHAQGGSDDLLRFIRFLKGLPQEQFSRYTVKFPEPPHWRTFYAFVQGEPCDSDDRQRGIDLYARREFQAAVRADAIGETYLGCRHLARILEHCSGHSLYMPAMEKYERLRELHTEVKHGRFDRIEFRRNVARRWAFTSRAIAAACQPDDEDEFILLPATARRLVRIRQACKFGESVSWSVWELDDGFRSLIGVRKSWESWRDITKSESADAEPTLVRRQGTLQPERTRKLLHQLAECPVTPWTAGQNSTFDPFRQFAVEFDHSGIAWGGTVPPTWSDFVDAAQDLREFIDASLNVWVHEQHGHSFYLVRPNYGPLGEDAAELVCGCVDHQTQVYVRPADPIPAMTCISPGRLQLRQLNWLIVNEQLVSASDTIPIERVITMDLTTRLVQLDWQGWAHDGNEDWVTAKLGASPSEYLHHAEPNPESPTQVSLKHLSLPAGPPLRPDNTPAFNDLDGQQWYMPLDAWDERNHLFATGQFVVVTSVGREWLEKHAPNCFDYHQLRLEHRER